MHDATGKLTDLQQGPETSSLPVHVGLDVHKESIMAAVAIPRESGSEISVENVGQFRNTPSAVAKLVGRLTRDFGPHLHFINGPTLAATLYCAVCAAWTRDATS